MRTLVTLSAAVLVASSLLMAQAPSVAWFGVPVPPGLGDPHRPILDVSAVTPAPATVPAGEDANRDLAGAAIRKELEAIVGFSRADRARGEKAWGRITGFRGAEDTHTWVFQQFTAAGLRDVETQTYTATQATWHPKSWSVALIEKARADAGTQRVFLESAFPTSGSRMTRGPFRAPLVLVGATADAALADVDVKD
jgi:hypothetical protein